MLHFIVLTPFEDIIIGGRYKLLHVLGSGGAAVVCHGDLLQSISLMHALMLLLGIDRETKQQVAIKLEHESIDPSMLDGEVMMFKRLQGEPGIPQVFWEGIEGQYHVMVSELLGPSLEDLFVFCGRNFDLKTVLLLADQLLQRLQYLHSNKVLHRDVKPENFLMGMQRQGNTLYVIDLGLASAVEAATAKISLTCIGTPQYASRTGHRGEGKMLRRPMVISANKMNRADCL